MSGTGMSGTGSPDGRRGGAHQRALGKTGEDAAAAWYEAHGYEVVARNWSCRQGELDIVARLGRLHVFCEVKARSSEAFGLPAEAVGPLNKPGSDDWLPCGSPKGASLGGRAGRAARCASTW